MSAQTAEMFVVPVKVARITHVCLRTKGTEACEGVVLWIGTFDPPEITRAVVPDQHTSAGRFRVPLRFRQELSRALAGTGQVLVAQVHSHPSIAFHSCVDDAEAIPRRIGAYSLVIPDFGARAHLLDGAALYRLDDGGGWVEAPLSTFVVPETFTAPQTAVALTTPTKASLWRRLIDTLRSFGRSRI